MSHLEPFWLLGGSGSLWERFKGSQGEVVLGGFEGWSWGSFFEGWAGTPKTIELHCQYEPFGAILVVGRLGIPLGAFQGVPGGGGSGRIRGMVLGIIFRGLGGDA